MCTNTYAHLSNSATYNKWCYIQMCNYHPAHTSPGRFRHINAHIAILLICNTATCLKIIELF